MGEVVDDAHDREQPSLRGPSGLVVSEIFGGSDHLLPLPVKKSEQQLSLVNCWHAVESSMPETMPQCENLGNGKRGPGIPKVPNGGTRSRRYGMAYKLLRRS